MIHHGPVSHHSEHARLWPIAMPSADYIYGSRTAKTKTKKTKGFWMSVSSVVARPLVTTFRPARPITRRLGNSLGKMGSWKRVLFWAATAVQAADTDLFDFEKTQLTTATLANAQGSGLLDAGNLTNLFGPAGSSQSSSGKKAPPRCKAYPGTPEWPSDAV